MSNYRFDNRNKKEFAKYIKLCHEVEADIAIRICYDMYTESQSWPILIPNGCDMSGELIENKQVNGEPDFYIYNNFVEITRAFPVCKRYFHQKTSKVKLAIKNGYDFVFVNGYRDGNPPVYLYVNSDELELATNMAINKYGGVGHPTQNGGYVSKESYRYDLSWFEGMWKKLPQRPEVMPQVYKNILSDTIA